MLPIRLEIKNFLAYRSPDPLRFEGIHLACITGPNGAGKSSLLDAITWALWGKARARRDEELVHQGQTDMYVQLDFEQENTLYRVIRRRTRKSGGSGTLDLFIVKGDGEMETRSEPSMKATQQKINDLLRLDYETFVHSAFLQQGRADAFTTTTPAARKKILGDILGLSRWEAYEETVKEQLKAVAETLAVIESRIREIDHELAREPGLRREVEMAEVAQREAHEALQVAELRLNEVINAPNDLRAAQTRKAELDRQVRERERDVETVNSEIKNQLERIADLEAVLNMRAEIEQGYAVLQSARQTDHSLGDKLIQLADFDKEQHRLERELDAVRAELREEVGHCAATITQLERTISTARPDDLSELEAEIMTLQDLDEQREQFQEDTVSGEKERAELKATNVALYTEMKTLEDRLKRLRAAEGASCPLCGQPLDEQHRTELIAELEIDGKQRGDTYRANQGRMDALNDEVSESRKRATELSLEVKRLGALKERAAALQAGVTAAQEAEARMVEAEAQRAAAQRRLDEEDFGQDLRLQLAELGERRTAIGYNSEEHTAARQQLETYREYESRYQKLGLADAALPDMRGALENAHARRDRFEKALDSDRKSFIAVQAEMLSLELLVQEYHARDQEVRKLRVAERNASEKLIIARQELKSMENARTRKVELERQRDGKRQERAVFEELRTAFGKNGIPAMIIESAIPELENGANILLSRMTDGRMNLTLTTQREKVTGGVAETLDIQIADELGTRSYEMYSGGEAFRINFALRVALSQLLARRAGAHLRTLFLDEGFGTQDEEGRNKLVEAINAVQYDFDLIFVITHIEDLRDAFPVHVVVDKTRDGSRISIR